MSLRKRVKIPLIMGAVLTVIVLFAYFSVQPRTWNDIERSKVLNVRSKVWNGRSKVLNVCSKVWNGYFIRYH